MNGVFPELIDDQPCAVSGGWLYLSDSSGRGERWWGVWWHQGTSQATSVSHRSVWRCFSETVQQLRLSQVQLVADILRDDQALFPLPCQLFITNIWSLHVFMCLFLILNAVIWGSVLQPRLIVYSGRPRTLFHKQDPHKRNACRVPDILNDLKMGDTPLPVTYKS